MSDFKELFNRLEGELLEISVGDEFEDIQQADNTKRINGVVYGRLKEHIADFVLVDCCYVDKDGKVKFGNEVYINTWSIKMMTKMTHGSLHDVMMSSAHTNKMKRTLGLK